MAKATIVMVRSAVLAGSFSLVAGAAFSQSTWQLASTLYGGSCTQNSINSGNFNNSWSCTGVGTAGTALTASAWSADSDRGVSGGINGTGAGGTSTATKYGDQYYLSGSGTGFASALLSPQGSSGFGGTSRLEAQSASASGDPTPLSPASPNHSFDSIAPGSYDMILLDFGAATSVILDAVGIGWTGGDSDLTVMRWTGNTAPTQTSGNLSFGIWSSASPGTAGWQLVGSYADLGTDNTTPFGGAARSTGATQASSWWLISSFNTALNGDSPNCLKADGKTLTSCGGTNDSFKLNYVATRVPTTTTTTGVAEPGSLALAGVALLGVIGSRRRTTKRH